MTLFANDFSKAFSALLQKSKVSCYQISEYTGLDQAYLSRLKNGEKNNPSAGTILKIALALAHLSDGIRLGDIESLFNSAGRSIMARR